MIRIDQLPAKDILINAKANDTLSVRLGINRTLTGYTIEFICAGVTTSMNNVLSSGSIKITFVTTGLSGTYPWTLRWTTNTGEIRTVLSGNLVVS
jgi:hypothetical protein